jgi:pimeloyl-ACP methyl ester carboxylesterase
MITRMSLASRKWKWGIAAGLLLAVVALWNPLSSLFLAARLALVLQRQASGATGEGFAVKEAKISRQVGNQGYEALLYYPAKSPATRAVIIVAGLSELGCYHPSLVAFSRLMANTGFLVIAPDIRMFRSFQISAEPIEQILFWHSQVGKLEESQKVQKTGLAGISFSGTLALMAAARQEIRDKVAFVMGIGPYYDMIRCAKDWFAAGPVTVSDGYYPTRFYAKWIVMLAALDILAGEDRLFMHSVLDALLLQKKVPPPAPGLTAAGARWYRLATMREDQADSDLAKQIEEYLVSRIYRELDPQDSLGKLRCPAFFLHGVYDDLIPPGESLELHRRIARSYVLISPFLTHTHPSTKRLSLQQKTRAVFDTIIFCYQLSRAIR